MADQPCKCGKGWAFIQGECAHCILAERDALYAMLEQVTFHAPQCTNGCNCFVFQQARELLAKRKE
jgi:hypothetical protein